MSPIGDHALLGDTRTAALVSANGELDWMCIPSFDGDPIFGTLVDPEHGGVFSLIFAQSSKIERSYIEGSAALETITHTSTGVARVTETMVANVSNTLLPQNLLIRRAECLEGRVHLDVNFDPRMGLPGRAAERVRNIPAHSALVCEWGSLAVCLQSDPALSVEPGVPTSVDLDEGNVATFTVAIADRCPVALVSPAQLEQLLTSATAWWQEWSRAIEYQGPHRDAVVRSLLTLRLLTYSPSGAPVAAPTTSLPEEIGGSRNWDYRYAWPRDAAIGLAGFLATGDSELADSFMHWLLHASRLSRPRVRVLYDIHGKKTPPESAKAGVSGHRTSAPVHVGNGADEQHQLDVYGWIVDAAFLLDASGGTLDGESWRAVAGWADLVCGLWSEPDAGIWEVRGPPKHYVHSKLMGWLALDRATRIANNHGVKPTRLHRWERERDAIAEEVRQEGVDHQRGTFVRSYGDSELDASLLLLPVLEFEPAGSPLITGTIDAVREDLEIEPGLLYRYLPGLDGLKGKEGAFLPCSFWLVQALARTGQMEEASSMFEQVLGYANDVGLFSEELDPGTKEALGNFPQAFTHAALVQAAVALGEATREKAA